MAEIIRWQDPEGQLLLNKLARKLVPQWTDGLRQKQDKVIGHLLDREDTVYCMATGGGKSAAFSLPILIHQELTQNLSLYSHHLKLLQGAKAKPVGVVVMATKGLAGSMVHSQRLSVPYNRD